MQPFPSVDQDREGRVVSDICDLLHDHKEATQNKVKRWIKLILMEAAMPPRRWWFLDNVASTTLDLGQDIVDLTGHIGRIAAIYCPVRLHKTTLQHITELRMSATAESRANGGYPTHYALEAGRRVHLWPCPHLTMPFAAMYQRPMDLAIVPDEWEMIVVNGVLGRFGRHFDRDQLTQDPADFELRYLDALRRAALDGYDVERIEHWDDTLPSGSSVTANSSTDTAVAKVTPASLTGIGYVSVETGDYTLQVA